MALLRQLADQAGLSQAYLSRVENYKTSLTIAGLEKVANALAVAVTEFFAEADSRTPVEESKSGLQ